MSEIVQFPGAVAPSDHSIANGEDRRHAQAFRDLESEVCDLNRWADTPLGSRMRLRPKKLA